MNISIWKSEAAQTSFPTLDKEITAEVAIVGGGITGVTCAYLLAREGKKVVLLESGKIAGGTSGDSTGNLYAMVDQRLHHIQNKWDNETAAGVAQSRVAAIDLIEELVEKHSINCDFKRVPWYLFSETNKKDEIIEKEIKTASQYGFDVKELEALPLPVPVSKAIKIENQAQFNPAAFTRELAAAIDTQNCSIYENSPVMHIENGEKHLLTTPLGKVSAEKVIFATHTPKGFFALQTALYPYREYVVAAKLNSEEIPPGIFWDTEANYHYSMRSYKKDGLSYVVVVGGHHKVGQADNYEHFYEKLEQNARKYFDIGPIEYRWSAQHYKPADGLPFIGESADNGVYIATGFSTDGLTYGVLSAILLNDELHNRKNKWHDLYKASRFTPIKSAAEFVKENLNVAKQYFKNLPGAAEADTVSDVKLGEGKVVQVEGEKWAVYKDELGQVHSCSAICTHLGCVVDWNDAEKSWDCPCHGSRFTTSGEVIEGPALLPLEKK